MGQKISRDMTFNYILEHFPETAEVLERFNLDCAGCMGAMTESIADGARAHGLNADEVLVALNAAVED